MANPAILGFDGIPGLAGQGLPPAATAAMTCLGAGVISILMGVVGRMPVAMATSVGFSATLAFSVIHTLGLSWPQAMGIVVVEGLLILITVLTRLRVMVMDAIPMNLKRAIGVGIGFLVTILGFQSAGFMTADPGTLLRGADFLNRGVGSAAASPGGWWLAAGGLVLTAVLLLLEIPAALFLGIVGTTLVAWVCGAVRLPEVWFSVPNFSTFLQVDIAGGIAAAGLIPWLSVLLALMLTDFFDTMGAVIAVGERAGLLDSQGRLPRAKQVLLVDAVGTIFGGLCGCASVTTYVESLAGVAAGGRTGVVSVVVGILFLAAMFVAPLATAVPPAAIAPVLILTGFFMIRTIRDIEFDNLAEGVPAFLVIAGIPLSFEISQGIGYGFIAYVVLMLVRGRFRDLHPLMILSALLFAVSFAVHIG